MARRKKTSRQSRTSPRSRRQRQRKDCEEEEDVSNNNNESSDEDECIVSTPRSRRRRPLALNEDSEDENQEKESSGNESEDDDEEEESEAGAVWTSSSEEDENDEEESQKKPTSTRRIRKHNRRKVGRVGDDDIGAEDEDDDDGENDATPSSTFANQPSVSRLRPPPRSQRRSAFYDSSDNDDNKDKKRNPLAICKQCPSMHDAVTNEVLSQPHVCYYVNGSADGTRHCFDLETLRKIALHYQSKSSDDPHDCWRQPPHFRTPLQDDLRDQIACRFGRDALNLNGDYFKRRTNDTATNTGTLDDYVIPARATEVRHLEQQMYEYARSTMGSRDVYVCPICYEIAHDHCLPAKYHHSKTAPLLDPIEVLAGMGMGIRSTDKVWGLDFAARYCHFRMSDTKHHLRQHHGIDTKDLSSELYKGYALRAPDGLVQRYLGKRTHGRGSLQHYWFDGRALEFVYLMDLIHDWQEENRQEEDSPEWKEFLKDANVEEIWEDISAPFRKHDDKMDAFIVDGEVEEEEGSDSENVSSRLARYDHQQVEDEVADAQRAVTELESRYATQETSEESESSILVDTDEGDGEDSEESSSEDDDAFLRRIAQKRGSIGARRSKPKRRSATPPSTTKRRIIASDESE